MHLHRLPHSLLALSAVILPAIAASTTSTITRTSTFTITLTRAAGQASSVLTTIVTTATATTTASASATATATATTTASASSDAALSYTDDTTFEDTILNVTNTIRAEYNASALTWNDTLATYAENWVNQCNFSHSGGPYGENLAEGYTNASAATLAWAHEVQRYDFSDPGFSESTGHFTQLVWKASTDVGCARWSCESDDDDDDDEEENEAAGWYVVCEYWPRGNIAGRFEENVQVGSSGRCGKGDDSEGCFASLEGAAAGLRAGAWVAAWVGGVVVWLVV